MHIIATGFWQGSHLGLGVFNFQHNSTAIAISTKITGMISDLLCMISVVPPSSSIKNNVCFIGMFQMC